MSRPPVTRDFLAKGAASVLSGHSIVNTCAERSNEPVRAKIESDSAPPCRSDASLRCSRVSRLSYVHIRLSYVHIIAVVVSHKKLGGVVSQKIISCTTPMKPLGGVEKQRNERGSHP